METANRPVTARDDRNIITSHDCPECGAQWIADQPEPGILHSTRLCRKCQQQRQPRRVLN